VFDTRLTGQKDLLKILQKIGREEIPAWVETSLSARPQDRISSAILEGKLVIINMDSEATKEDMSVFLDLEMKPFFGESET